MYKYVFVILFTFLVLIFFYNRGFAHYDEGFILHAAQRVVQGELPYRDFDLIYTPGTVFLTAAAFKIFGESVLTGRILELLVSLLAGYLVYIICYRATKNNFGSFLAVLIYLAWGPTHINFPWPSMFALTTGLAALWFIPNYFIAGFLTFVTFFIKQNFGVAVFLIMAFAIGLISQMRQMRNVLKFLFGFITGLSLFLAYLLLTKSLTSFLNNLYFYTIKRFLLEGVALTPFPSGLKGLFYLLPVILSLGAIILVRKNQSFLILPIFTLFFYLFGIRPTTDFVHLTSLMSLTGIPLSIIIFKFENLRFVWKTCWLFLGILLIALGFYTSFFKNYYRWDSPLVKQKYYISNAKAKIFVDQKFSKVIPEVVSEIKKNTGNDDYIFIFPNAPMFYFLSGKKNPTRFINLPLGLHTSEQEREVVDDLKKKRVRLVLTNERPESSNYRVISEYIRKNYLKKKEIFEFTLWEKYESLKYFQVLNR